MLKQIFKEHKYIICVIDSCITEEQLESAKTWYISAVARWDYMFENVSIATYYRKYYDIICFILEDIECTINKKKSTLKKADIPKINGFK